MAVHTKALLEQLKVPTYHFHEPKHADEFDGILNHTFIAKKHVAILTDDKFWSTIS
jgi:sulfopyruvate decarboxylase subunit alpha